MQETLEIVERLRRFWRKTWNFNYRGWNFYEAVVYDEEGISYKLSAGAMGNKYLSISTAWIATQDRWYFINRNFFTQVSHSSEHWRTSDGCVESYFDPECGFEILAESPQGKLDLRFIPNPRYYLLNDIKNRQTKFELFLYNHCEVKGYITLEGAKKRVCGIGSIEHFYGRFAEKTNWDYFSMKNPETSLYFRTSRTKKDYLSRTVGIYTPEKAYLMQDPITQWNAVNANHIEATAVQDGMELKVKLNLFQKNPENAKQPYINFHLPPFKKIYAHIHEWCVVVEAQFTVDGQTREYSGEGICHLTEANW